MNVHNECMWLYACCISVVPSGRLIVLVHTLCTLCVNCDWTSWSWSKCPLWRWMVHVCIYIGKMRTCTYYICSHGKFKHVHDHEHTLYVWVWVLMFLSVHALAYTWRLHVCVFVLCTVFVYIHICKHNYPLRIHCMNVILRAFTNSRRILSVLGVCTRTYR